VARTPRGVQFEGHGEVIDWAVKMQRLPDDATFQERLRRGEVGAELMEALARRVAAFHRGAETNERLAAFGRFEAVARLVRDLFAQAAPRVGTTVSRTVFDRVRELAEGELARLRPLIERRAARGVPRDCHGDLHLDHVYVFPGREPPADLVIVDCIEFNERFRCSDPVADMAFVAMDLAFSGRRDLARAFADAYFRAAADEEGRALLPLYTAYRAAVRGTVEGLLLAEPEVPAEERAPALRRARAHWLLALTELEAPGRRPCLLLVAGLPGSGKSTLARGLADRAGFCVVRSDAVRKELAGLPGHGLTPPHVGESLYTAEWNERTYGECRRRAEQFLFEGNRVLVDATFREERQRQTFREAAVRWGVPGEMLLCQAGPETVRRRLETRRGDVSDADWSVYLRVAERWEEMGALTRRCLHVLSTEGDPGQVLAWALEALRQAGLQG
jgi:aminoglycoside phosphotransferase family enzyme/predicted kinase